MCLNSWMTHEYVAITVTSILTALLRGVYGVFILGQDNSSLEFSMGLFIKEGNVYPHPLIEIVSCASVNDGHGINKWRTILPIFMFLRVYTNCKICVAFLIKCRYRFVPPLTFSKELSELIWFIMQIYSRSTHQLSFNTSPWTCFTYTGSRTFSFLWPRRFNRRRGYTPQNRRQPSLPWRANESD